MDIQAITANRSIPVTQIVKATYAGGKLSLPVQKSQFLYANLKHVNGIPAPRQNSGYSLSKLKALDNLIERLNSADQISKQMESSTIVEKLSKYAEQISELARDPNPYKNISVESGMLVNITA